MPQKGSHSIERLHADLLLYLPDDIQTKFFISKYPSTGFFKRLFNAVQAFFFQGDVNHVTGDVNFLTFFLKRKRTVLTVLDCVMMERLQGIKRWFFWLLWLWIPEKRCTAIIVISEATRQQLLRYVDCDPEKIKIIYCPVSDEFKPVARVFNQSCPRILQVGTSQNKNIELVAAALAGLPCKLLIVGSLSTLQLRALALHKIDFENLQNLSREALVAQYVACDLLMFASTYEGFGLPIVEANAVGRPVVTSNIWSMPEVAGNSACLVDPFDALSIRTGVMHIVDDSAYRDSLVTNGFENVKRFQLNTIAAQYADLYRQVYSKSKQ